MNEGPRLQVAALILAAGLSSRFRAAEPSLPTKLVALVGGCPIVRQVAEAALASRARPILVVTGHAAEAVRTALQGLDVQFVENPQFATGLASSLKAGLAAVPAVAGGALVLLGDMPIVSHRTLDQLINLFQAAPNCAAVAPTYRGIRGNPALISRRLFAHLAKLQGDEGARKLIAEARDEVIEWEADGSVTLDIDTPDELLLARTMRAPHEDA